MQRHRLALSSLSRIVAFTLALTAWACPSFAASTLEGHYEWVGGNGSYTNNYSRPGQYTIVDIKHNKNRWKITWWSFTGPYAVRAGILTAATSSARMNAEHALVFSTVDDQGVLVDGSFTRIKDGYRLRLQPHFKRNAPILCALNYGERVMQRTGPVRLVKAPWYMTDWVEQGF